MTQANFVQKLLCAHREGNMRIATPQISGLEVQIHEQILVNQTLSEA